MKRLAAVVASMIGMVLPAAAADSLPPSPGEAIRAAAPAAIEQPRLLFVGSSSIRLWDVGRSFPATTAINIGINGATAPIVLRSLPATPLPERPGSVIVYVGENDIAAGAKPQAVADAVQSLIERIRRDYPSARIVYLSMKPSPQRWPLWREMAATNGLIRARSGRGGYDFLDVGTVLLGSNGQPDPRFFRPDGLHMNDSGYARWKTLIDAYLGAAVRTVGVN